MPSSSSPLYLAVAVAVALAVAVSAGPSVTTTYGTLSGIQGKNAIEYLGVPFATPPVGDLRWMRPTPPAHWGSRDAIFYGDACYQKNDTFTVLNKVSEDCLYLNVYAPVNPKSDNLPVMIFFYGGSWAEGAASFFLYDGQFDIKLTEDVIIVTANYRLNVFGFLGSASLAKEDSDGSTGNLGLLDQRAAMQFMKDNAAAFGGDPNNVMIFGESAGAGSTSAHLCMPNSWPLFQRAAMESGPIADWTAKPMYSAQSQFDTIAANLGCNTASDVLSCMRSKDSATVYEAAKHVGSALFGLLQWCPVIDGVELVDEPRKLASEGKLNKVPVLLGTNADEGTIFTRFAPHNVNMTGVEDYLVTLFGVELAPQVLKMYPESAYSGQHPENTPWWVMTHIFGDSQMSCAARRTARWLSESTGEGAYLYFYSHILEIIQLFVKFIGCSHGSELPMVFHQDAVLIGDGEKPLSTAFVKYWTSFATSGNPNYEGGVNWASYTAADDTNIRLDIPITSETGLKKELCDFWDANPMPASRIWGPPPSEEQ